MASLSDLASHHHSHHHHHHHHPHNKITKPRGGKMVKPILKKLHSSPKNSLDLDRGWEDQTIDLGYGTNSPYETGRSSFTVSRSTTRDVGFGFNAWDQGYGSGGGSAGGSGTATPTGSGMGSMAGLESSTASVVIGGGAGTRSMNRSRYQHTRSTSATSHVSIATNGSNHRPGASFVHPFQQTPRTNTPPLAYANSFTSFERENNPARDYSPTIITENDDDDDDFHIHHGGSSSLSQSLTSPFHKPQPSSNSHSTTSLRRPSLASQHTSSLSDIRSHVNAGVSTGASTSAISGSISSSQNPGPPLRINTTTSSFARSVPTQSSKLAHGSLNTSYSHSDLQLNQQSPNDSPRPSINLSPSTSQAPMSPLRTSLEGAFRLRSRSEVDTGSRREDIREARRRFEEAERIKQEKYEAEQRRKAERKQEKRKNTNGSEMSSVGRPSFSRKRTPPSTGTQARRVKSGDSAGRAGLINEKVEGPGFMSSSYANTEGGAAPSFGPDVHDVRFETPRRSTTTKRKTQSYWTSFMLWLRTRLFKLGRR